MKECIYCRKVKDEDKFSLEHIIPQCLGGAHAPVNFKTRDVCARCNNNLGLFVDASFEKDYLVYNELLTSAYAFFDPEKPTGLPLHCMGKITDIEPLNIKSNEICEFWVGPLGEQVFWIRPDDEKMYWYSGGNPREVKSKDTRAYFMFSERSPKNTMVSILTFMQAFPNRKVKKLLCTKTTDGQPQDIGFHLPDTIDDQRIVYLNSISDNKRKCTSSMYLGHADRFMAKLAIGLSHVLIGSANDDYRDTLHNALWFREGDKAPEVHGSDNWSQQSNTLKGICGIENAVTISIMTSPQGLVVNLNINKKMNWLVVCSKPDNLDASHVQKIGEGICIVLYKTLNKGIQITLPELIAHNSGCLIHPELKEIENLAGKHRDYFKDL